MTSFTLGTFHFGHFHFKTSFNSDNYTLGQMISLKDNSITRQFLLWTISLHDNITPGQYHLWTITLLNDYTYGHANSGQYQNPGY